MLEKNNFWPLPVCEPEAVGLSSDRLNRINARLSKYVQQKTVPNLVTLVARNGKIVHCNAIGYMDFDSQKAVGLDTIFRLYSNTKPITGMAVMMLFEDGKLGLDDPISKYIPSFSNQLVLTPGGDKSPDVNPSLRMPLVPARRGITIRDCVCNTTGLMSFLRVPAILAGEYRELMEAAGLVPGKPAAATVKDRLDALGKLPLMAQPGTEFEYHVGYPLLCAVLEIIAGKTLGEFFQERIFKPLDMKDSSFYLPQEKIERFSTCYTVRRDGQEWKLVAADHPETSSKVKGPPVFFDGGGEKGGLLSTVADYVRFVQVLLNGGELEGVRLLGRKSVEIMTTNQTGSIFVSMPGYGYGFGFGLGFSVYTGGSQRTIMRSVGSFGWGGGAGTSFFCDPKENLIGICFTQVLNHAAIPGNLYRDDFERMVYLSLI